MKHNSSLSCGGFTFLELIVAVSIASVVVVLSFRILHDTSIGIRMQGKRVEQVEAMVLSRKKIESVINRIDVITDISSHQVTFTDFDSDTVTILELKGDSLVVNDRTLCKEIKKVKFELDDTKKEQNVFYWECELQSGKWVGGAKKLRKRQ